MTLRQLVSGHISSRYGEITFEGADPDTEISGDGIVATMRGWEAEANSSYFTWPVVGVPVPTDKDVEDGWYAFSLMAGGTICVIYNSYKERELSTLVRVYTRTSDADYWPTEEVCQAVVSKWADLLEQNMLAYVGNDCREGGPNVTPASHWEWAKRRYQLKDNQTCRLAFLAEMDPEGRHRCNTGRPLPEHVERYLRFADFLVGVRSGVDQMTMAPDSLYASGGVLGCEELLEWCKTMLPLFLSKM